jgi:hypothetical protein
MLLMPRETPQLGSYMHNCILDLYFVENFAL